MSLISRSFTIRILFFLVIVINIAGYEYSFYLSDVNACTRAMTAQCFYLKCWIWDHDQDVCCNTCDENIEQKICADKFRPEAKLITVVLILATAIMMKWAFLRILFFIIFAYMLICFLYHFIPCLNCQTNCWDTEDCFGIFCQGLYIDHDEHSHLYNCIRSAHIIAYNNLSLFLTLPMGIFV